MSRFWSILFFCVPVLAIVSFLIAVLGMGPLQPARLPESISEPGDAIDGLFHGIHILAAVILLGTGLCIGWALWRFDHRRSATKKALYIHHNTKLEIIWTIIPAIILVALALLQMQWWAKHKMNRPTMTVDGQEITRPPLVMVKAKRFGWEFHYAGADGLVETQDDVYVENLLVVPAAEDIVLQLESRDVIHSLFIPELRLKQDIVPGSTQFVWFKARSTGEMQILCTELCGWGHYKMIADVKIVDRRTFNAWLAKETAKYRPELKKDGDG